MLKSDQDFPFVETLMQQVGLYAVCCSMDQPGEFAGWGRYERGVHEVPFGPNFNPLRNDDDWQQYQAYREEHGYGKPDRPPRPEAGPSP